VPAFGPICPGVLTMILKTWEVNAVKLVTAVVRQECLDGLVATLVETGVHGLTVSEVKGFGRQFGQLTVASEVAGLNRRDGLGGRGTALLPKVRLDIVVDDSEVDGIVQALLKSTQSGSIGDGKIWISTLDGVIRVRTGEQDAAAI
jgi:nitrogen regulatory protein P-II 1